MTFEQVLLDVLFVVGEMQRVLFAFFRHAKTKQYHSIPVTLIIAASRAA